MNSLYLNNNPGADFTFTMTVERVAGTNKVVVVVPLGAPFDMTTTISASGGQLPVGVSTVTVRVGQTRSDEIAITPLEGTTVSLGAAPAVPTNYDGITTAVGNPAATALPMNGGQVPGVVLSELRRQLTALSSGTKNRYRSKRAGVSPMSWIYV